MEIIEKNTVKEIPSEQYYDKYHNYRNINGKANAGLTLGIIGTVLGAGAWLARGGAGLFGIGGANTGSTNINVNGMDGMSSGNISPTAFQAWEKGCQDTLALQAGLYNQVINYQNQRFQDREVLNSELFGLYKSQIDADFGLYKSTRDGLDLLNSKHNQDAFNLYKSQRDADDSIRKELSDLKMQVAINAAIRPYQDKLIQCEINAVKKDGAIEDERIINYINRLDCRNIKGTNVLISTPTVTGIQSNTCCFQQNTSTSSSSTPAA